MYTRMARWQNMRTVKIRPGAVTRHVRAQRSAITSITRLGPLAISATLVLPPVRLIKGITAMMLGIGTSLSSTLSVIRLGVVKAHLSRGSGFKLTWQQIRTRVLWHIGITHGLAPAIFAEAMSIIKISGNCFTMPALMWC